MSDSARLRLLYQIIEIANSSIDLKERQEQVLDSINRALDIKEALLFLRDQETTAFAPACSSPRGLREALPLDWQPSQEFIGPIMLYRQPVILDQEIFQDKVLQFLSRRGAVLLLPVFDDSNFYGLLALVCHVLAPHAADYFAALRLAQEVLMTAPALLGCGVLMAAVGQLVLSKREE